MKTRSIFSLLLWRAVLASSAIRQASAFDGASFLRWRTTGKESIKIHLIPRGGALRKRNDPVAPPTMPPLPAPEDLPKRATARLRGLLKSSKIVAAFLPLVLTFLWASGSAQAASGAPSSAVLPKRLGTRNIVLSTMVLVTFGVLPLSYFGITSLARSLLVSASRCALQVSLLGSIVLQRMMGVTKPEIVLAWILGVGLIAGREAISRIQYSYPNRNRNLYGSVLMSGLTTLGLTISLNLFGSIQPWFDPRTWIPIAGMLFGNTLNASALSASSITKQFATSSESVELSWMRGATTQEAVKPLLEESLRVSLLPTINGLAATGIIHIPGMMSGQILAGQSPQQAALYQIVIMFLISSTAILSVQLIIHSTVRSIVDTQKSRLRGGVLEPLTDSASTAQGELKPPMFRRTVSARKRSKSIYLSSPILEIKNLEVPRANSVIDLELCRGDRVAISGKSGAGKTQILRTIVGLEPVNDESQVSLCQTPLVLSNLPSYRSKVCLVTPNKPNLEGTPNQFYEKILSYNSQHGNAKKRNSLTPSDIAQKWGISTDVLDRDWRTLSGGESQRATLAIALALEPEVLLLDESTSLLDQATSIRVEETLRESKIPMIVVTHSEDQLNRFCTHKLTL